jgi:hypothetical protein
MLGHKDIRIKLLINVTDPVMVSGRFVGLHNELRFDQVCT